jgi:putative ABC transport system substrate-binding protein
MFLLALAILAAPLAAQAQQAAKVRRIGFLCPGRCDEPQREAFWQGLRELGYVEGQNIAIESRSAEGKLDRLPELALDLVRLKVDVIVVGAEPSAQAAKRATTTIPIVMAVSFDPVGSGLVASLARPGGNLTGLATLNPELAGKRLELLKETVPGVVRIAVLRNSNNPITTPQLRETRAAAQALGLELQSLDVQGPEDFDAAFQAATKARAGALIVLSDGVTNDHRTRLVGFAAKSRLPAMYGGRPYVDAGGLMAYGANGADNFRRAATYVDKILKGAKPADLPIEQPTKFELVINFKTAKALGLTIPQSILVRADEVIQ